METVKTTKVEATYRNIDTCLQDIEIFAYSKGYVIEGKQPQSVLLKARQLANTKVKLESLSKTKVLSNYLTQLSKKISMSQANKFLHFLAKHVYNQDGEKAMRVNYSEKEILIKVARKKWKDHAAETEKLRLAYKAEKKDFYSKTTESKKS